MATILDRIRTTIELMVQRLSSKNIGQELRIASRQCRLLATKANGTLHIVDEFSNVLRDAENQRIEILPWEPAAVELHGLLKDAERLIDMCCCGDEWLKVAIDRGNLKLTFGKLLYDIEWHESVLCSSLVLEKNAFVQRFCDGNLTFADNFKLLAASKKDFQSLLDLLRRSHVCDEVCEPGTDGGCLARKLLKKMEEEEIRVVVRRETLPLQSPLLLWVNSQQLPKGKALGRGSFAKVRKTTWLGLEYAKKVFNSGSVHQVIFKQEVTVMAGLDHPNVLRIVCCFADSELGIVMELMHKSLFDVLNDFRNKKYAPGAVTPFSITQAVDLMLQLAEGVRYLHSKHLAHRDIKSGNVLLQFADPKHGTTEPWSNGNTCPFIAKVADFGLTKIKNTSTHRGHQTLMTGTRPWMAPEAYKYEWTDEPTPSSRYHPMKLDVYGFGIMCCEILSGEEPYQKLPSYAAVKAGERPKLPDYIPERLAALIQLCWHGNPRMRPVFTTICTELRFIKGLLLRGDQEALRNIAIDVGGASMNIGDEVKVRGPWGVGGGSPFFDGVVTSIKSISVWYMKNPMACISCVEIEYEVNERSFFVTHGKGIRGSKYAQVKIDEPNEYVIEIEGSYGVTAAVTVGNAEVVSILSLAIRTNLTKYGPFGGSGGTQFSSGEGKVVGVFGRSDMIIDQIGFFTVAPEAM